jgi:hypothetical protein
MVPSPHLKMTSQGFQVNPVLPIPAIQWKLVSGGRTVEDPLQAKSNLEKVDQTREYYTNKTIHFVRKTYPKFS